MFIKGGQVTKVTPTHVALDGICCYTNSMMGPHVSIHVPFVNIRPVTHNAFEPFFHHSISKVCIFLNFFLFFLPFRFLFFFFFFFQVPLAVGKTLLRARIQNIIIVRNHWLFLYFNAFRLTFSCAHVAFVWLFFKI